MTAAAPPLVLVLVATGLIGRAATVALVEAGFRVRALARAPGLATRPAAKVEWVFADLATLTEPEAWRPLLDGCSVVVNAAGALQDSARDDLDAVHVRAIAALAAAAPAAIRLVHVSAPRANPSSPTAFDRTKGLGDRSIAAAACQWVILRPVLVLSPEAYGGSALLRALAAFPLAIPAIHSRSLIQTVAIGDVTRAILMAAEGRLPHRTDMALAEPQARTLAAVLGSMRHWLGFRPAPVIEVPRLLAATTARLADIAGALGWRSPLRSTALRVASENVTADPAGWSRLTGQDCSALETTLGAMPPSVQERWFARLYLTKPLAIVGLALFWLLSGVLGLFAADVATRLLTDNGLAATFVKPAVIAGAVADMALGAAVLYRPWSKAALIGMIVLSAFYLLAATIIAPHLWLDPLGPLVKVIPAMLLAMLTLAILPER